MVLAASIALAVGYAATKQDTPYTLVATYQEDHRGGGSLLEICKTLQSVCHENGQAVQDGHGATGSNKLADAWEGTGADTYMWRGPFIDQYKARGGDGTDGYEACFWIRDALYDGLARPAVFTNPITEPHMASKVLVEVVQESGATVLAQRHVHLRDGFNVNNQYKPICMQYDVHYSEPYDPNIQRSAKEVEFRIKVISGRVRADKIELFEKISQRQGLSLPTSKR